MWSITRPLKKSEQQSVVSYKQGLFHKINFELNPTVYWRMKLVADFQIITGIEKDKNIQSQINPE